MLKRLVLVAFLLSLTTAAGAPVFALQPPATDPIPRIPERQEIPAAPAPIPRMPSRQEIPPAQEKFVPIDQLPPEEKLPAAPFLISAYAVVWLIAMFYIWTIWQRVNKLEGEFRTLERRARKDNAR